MNVIYNDKLQLDHVLKIVAIDYIFVDLSLNEITENIFFFFNLKFMRTSNPPNEYLYEGFGSTLGIILNCSSVCSLVGWCPT